MSKKYRYIKLLDISKYEGCELVHVIPARKDGDFHMAVICFDDTCDIEAKYRDIICRLEDENAMLKENLKNHMGSEGGVMAKCKDCIHYKVCQYHIDEETDMTVEECEHFVNKTNIIGIFNDPKNKIKEYTVTYTAEVTRIIKSDTDNMENFLVNDVPKFLCEDIKRKLPADDVRVSDYKVVVGEAE